MKKIIYLISFLLLPGILQAGAEEPGAKTRLESLLKEIKTFEANFKQELYSEKNTLIEEAKGKFYLSRPGKFRWNYLFPYEQSIIADGKKIWIYDIDLDQVTVRKMEDVLGNTPALLLSNELAISDEYIVSIVKDESDLEWFVLEPKDKENQYVDIRLAFMDNRIKAMELQDNFGQLTHVSFSEIRQNDSLDEGLFDFQPPEGVDVLDTLE